MKESKYIDLFSRMTGIYRRSPVKPGFPALLSVEPTSLCNLSCKFCARRTIGVLRSSTNPGHMSLSTWKQVLKAAQKVGFVNIGGWGESFSHPLLLDFMRDLDRQGIMMDMPTNGLYLTPRVVGELDEIENLCSIFVSIDSLNTDIFRELRGVELEKVLAGLQNLASGLKRTERIGVASIVMASTIDDLVAMPSLLNKLGIRRYCLPGLIDWNSSLPDETNASSSELASGLEAVRSECARYDINLVVLPNLLHRLRNEEQNIWENIPQDLLRSTREASAPEQSTRLCSSPWEHPFITKDGDVLPCCNCPPWEYLDSDGGALMGNINDRSFEEIWRGKEFTRFREQMLNGPPPRICSKCLLTSSGLHFFKLYDARIDFRESRIEGHEVKIVVENTGSAAWTHGSQLRIGTSRQRDRESAFYHPTWPNPRRAAACQEARVEPGGKVSFYMRITPHLGREVFQLVAEDVCWLKDTEFEIAIQRGPLNRKLENIMPYPRS